LTTRKVSTYLRTLLFDPLHYILNTIHVHRLVLVHIHRQSATSHQEEYELVHRLLLGGLVARRCLIRLHPVLHRGLEGNIGVE
jgi:hypothetical protein